MLKAIKKAVSLILAVAMVISLSSCIGTKKNSVDTNKPLELTMWTAQGSDYIMPKMPQNLEDRIPEKWLYDKTGVRVSNAFGNGGGQWEAKLTQLVAGNNLPHLFHLAGNQGPAHFAKLATGKLIHELTPELLQKYAPNVWKTIPKVMWERIKVDGKIYGIPYQIPISKDTSPEFSDEEINYLTIPISDVNFNQYSALWVRDDILKKLYPESMDYNEAIKLLEEKKSPIGDELTDIPIKTTNDYVKFLRDIKNLGLKSGDKPVYAFGYNGGDNWLALTYFGAEMMGYRWHQYPLTWNYKEKRLEMPLLGSLVKEAAKIQNKLLREEVIDPESLVHTSAQYKEKLLNGQYAVVQLTSAGDPATVNKQLEDAGKPYRFRPLYTQIKNHPDYPAFREPPIWGHSIALFNTISENDLPRVLKWVNTMFADEYEEIVAWGTKELGLYEQDENGKRKFKDEAYQEYYVEGNFTALDPVQSKLSTGLFTISKYTSSRFSPIVMSGTKKYVLNEKSGAKFTVSSQHTQDIKEFPPCKMNSPEYAQLPEVLKFWSSRTQWDDPFKLAFTAMSDDEFEIKWKQAVDNVYKLADVNSMLGKMTEIARPIAEKLGE